MLPTFPYFQLSQCSDLINDLGLSPSSYLDTWIPSSCHWEQQSLSVVRIVDSQQRLLYKIRPRLTEPLLDSECLSLPEELHLQGGINIQTGRRLSAGGSSTASSPSKSSRPLSNGDANGVQIKRPQQPTGSTSEMIPDSPKIQLVNGYYMAHPSPSTIVSTPEEGPPALPTTNDRTSNGNDDNMFIFQNMFYPQTHQQDSPTETNTASSPIGLPHYLLSPPASASPIPYHPHPPLKRWPNDYTVSEISTGFHAMDLLIAHTASSGGMTQRQAFERVFGCRYVKSTVCRHRAVWRKANDGIKEQFEALGADERACWGEFVRRVEGRPPGKSGGLGGNGGSPGDQMMSSSPTGGMGYQSGGEEDDGTAVHGQEGVMTMSQSQGRFHFVHFSI